MAIKTISKLDDFDNGIDSGDDSAGITGGSIKYWKQTYPKYNNETTTPPTSGYRTTDLRDNDAPGVRESGVEQLLEADTSNYYETLFEVSQPVEVGHKDLHQIYYSKQIPYRDLIKNISFDVKQYLNEKCGLYDTNIEQVRYESSHFGGLKEFEVGTDGTVGVIIHTYLTAPSMIANDTDVIIGRGSGDDWIYGSTGRLTVGAILTVDNNVNGVNINPNVYFKAASLTSFTNGVTVTNGLTGTGFLTANSSGLTVDNKISTLTVYFNQQAIGNGILTAGPDTINIAKPVNITSDINLNGNSNITGNINLNGGANITGNVVLNGTLNMGSNSITAGECYLTAQHARWSDLAEYYIADKQYQPGTIVRFGGINEVTIASNGIANAVVTTKPAFIMNNDLSQNELGCPIALCGRVPVLITGKVKKFDKIILSNIPGIGIVNNSAEKDKIIGISLHENSQDQLKLVECVVKMNL